MAKFQAGQLVITANAKDTLHPEDVPASLARHLRGDWGELDESDKQENEFSLQHGLRLLSAYTLSDGTRIWVITEADRSATTFLLPEEY